MKTPFKILLLVLGLVPFSSLAVTYTPTSTNSPTPTSTHTPTATGTSTNTGTPTATPSSTRTPTPSSTNTSVLTPTSTPTVTKTVTKTATPSPTSTFTPTSTQTGTATSTKTVTPYATATSVSTPTGRTGLEVLARRVTRFGYTYINITGTCGAASTTWVPVYLSPTCGTDASYAGVYNIYITAQSADAYWLFNKTTVAPLNKGHIITNGTSKELQNVMPGQTLWFRGTGALDISIGFESNITPQ